MNVERRLIVFIALLTEMAFFMSYCRPALAADGEDWPMFMKDAGHSSFTKENIAPPLKIKWKFKTGGPIYSSPVVANGKVFVGSNDGSLYAVDVKTGKGLWSFKTDAAVVSAPVVYEGRVYIGSKDGYLYALDPEKGTLLWKFKTKAKITSSAIAAINWVYFGSDDTYLYAVDLKTGKRKWRRKLRDYKYGAIFSTPVYKDGVIYAAGKNTLVYAFVANRAAKRWRFGIGSPAYSSPVVVDDVLYIGTFDGKLYAIKTPSKKPTAKWKKDLGSWIYASPVVIDKKIYIGTKKGEIFSLNVEDGSVIWKMKLCNSINSTMAVTAGNIGFVGCMDGNLHAVDLDKGKSVWSIAVLGGINSSPAVSQGMVFFSSKDGNLYALGK